jgi:alkanesulfonate monooxygenase SsuD/methylene tetrahydromethanopterin reductase-like flavin-dependent oxidoreductase (luciferase family)
MVLAWVAGQTDRARIAANVLNVLLRSPAILACSAASLDLLSSGRLDLALGAGAFRDAIAAMGGRRLTLGQAVDALGEVLAIIRRLWDAGDGRPLRFEGYYYQIEGAQRGPLPAHDIPICVGATNRACCA